MTGTPGQFEEWLKSLAAGRLDALTPEQVAALEKHLNGNPAHAGQLAEAVPARDALTRAVVQALDAAAPAMCAATWERVWENIATRRTGPEVRAVHRKTAVGWRLWAPLAAAAACLVLAALWRSASPPAERDGKLELSGQVEIHELEVFEGARSFVVAVDSERGAAVIWILPEEGA